MSGWAPVTEVALNEDQLERNFADIAPPLTNDYALLEASKCLYCYDAPCTIACPTHIDVPAFIKKIASGNSRGAARVILDANPMGHSCARACPVEVLCEGSCVLNDRDEQPIKIALLQRHGAFDSGGGAVGRGGTRRLGIPGEDLPGVSDALVFIEHLKTHPYWKTPIGRNVIVVGAGNTAIDAATQAMRLGAERVSIVYRRGVEDMSAYEYEYELAKRDGCEFRFHTVPKRVLGEGKVTGLECVRSEIGPEGTDGKRA